MSPEELFDKNTALAYWLIGKEFPSLTTDEDVQQEALIGLWRACTAYDESQTRFATFAAVCIRNQILQYLRGVNKYNKLVAVSLDSCLNDEVGSGPFISQVEDPSASIDGQGYDLKAFIEQLSKRESDVLSFHLQGATQTEAAKKLRVSQSYYSKVLGQIRNKYLVYEKTGAMPVSRRGRPRLKG